MQDAIFAIGNWVFAVALIHSIIRKQPPTASTSWLTCAVLAVFAYTWASLGFIHSYIAASALSVLWAILALIAGRGPKEQEGPWAL